MPGQIEGTVVSYGASGNLVTDITHEQLRAISQPASATVACDEHETLGVYPVDHQEQPMTLMAIFGSSGCLELTITGDSAKIMLGVPLGEKVYVKW